MDRGQSLSSAAERVGAMALSTYTKPRLHWDPVQNSRYGEKILCLQLMLTLFMGGGASSSK